MDDLDRLIFEELQDTEFAQIWKEGEPAYQNKKLAIEAKIEKNGYTKRVQNNLQIEKKCQVKKSSKSAQNEPK